jgi:predicted nucleic-acid-binding Zn-ribbon protein
MYLLAKKNESEKDFGSETIMWCPKCKKSSYKVYNKIFRDKSVQKFYDSALWKKIRSIKLRQEPLCIKCGNVATLVDHIQEFKGEGA